MEINKKLLYSSSSVTPIICERDNWKNCPDHKHLSEVPLKDDSLDQETINELSSNDNMIDDPNDDIISINEYQSALGQNNDKIKTQIDLMEGDSLLRRSYRYDGKQESSDKNVKNRSTMWDKKKKKSVRVIRSLGMLVGVTTALTMVGILVPFVGLVAPGVGAAAGFLQWNRDKKSIRHY
jgi:hypothetical protein